MTTTAWHFQLALEELFGVGLKETLGKEPVNESASFDGEVVPVGGRDENRSDEGDPEDSVRGLVGRAVVDRASAAAKMSCFGGARTI